MRPPRGLPLRSQTALVVLFFVAVLFATAAQDSNQLPQQWNDAMSQLADKIAVAARPARSLTLNVVQNNSSISPADAVLLSRLLETDLTARKIRVLQEELTGTIVYVDFSEGVEGPLLTAQVHRRDEEDTTGQIAIVALQERAASISGEQGVPLILRRKFIFAQAAQFVDFTLLDDSHGAGARLVLLQPDRLVYLKPEQAAWSLDRSFPVRSRFQISRDPRGTIANVDETLHAYLPHDTCVDSGDGQTNVECRPNIRSKPSLAEALGESWPLSADGLRHPSAAYAADRNYFEGVAVVFGDVMSRLPAFYSGAVMRQQRSPAWILAELDRNARLYDFFAMPGATFSSWGDDIVTVAADCEPAWLVLVSGTGDWTALDTLRIYRVADHQAATVGQPLEFSGPILALWPAEDGKSARVVSRNLQTGMYEASIVSVSCGN
jgi:hypothetical protein